MENNNFLQQFIQFIEEQDLFKIGHDKILVAVSGGIDSVVLAHLLHEHASEIGIAHCNFHLRGEESDADEKFTEEIAAKLGCDYYIKHFNTIEYAENEGISVEMAARDLRYAWFDEILNEQDYQKIATGHHLDDQIETFFINLARGTGISGLRGMPAINNKIIRPILFAFRSDIEEYAAENLIAHRYDSSNDSMSFKRNRIRHQLLPLFEELNPSFRQLMTQTMENLRHTETIYNDIVNQRLQRIISKENNSIHINIDRLKKLQPINTYLYELLSNYNFNSSVTNDIVEKLDDISGKQFFSKTHRLVKDRDKLIITKMGNRDDEDWHYLLNESDNLIKEPFQIEISHYIKPYKIITDKKLASLDEDLLKYPLSIRKWQNGDYFYPLGMKNRKKLSDYFSDNKFSLVDKENSWVLVSGDDIVWLIGHRIDERYKITEETKKIVEFRLI
jgi:tRNA(Ile)-lysidine synthase